MHVGTSLRFLFPAGPQTLGMYQAMAAALPPDAFTDRPMGSEDVARQAQNLVEIARAARAANMWGLLVGDHHAMPPQYANVFQPVPTIARLSAETGPMVVGMVLLAPFYHPLLLTEQVATLSAFRTAAAHGRPNRAVLRRDLHVADTDADARAHVDPILAQGYRGVGYDRLLVGSPTTVIARLRHYESMGFDHVMVRHITGDHTAMLKSFELLGDVVAAVA